MYEVDKVCLPAWCQESAVYNQGLSDEQQKTSVKVSVKAGEEKLNYVSRQERKRKKC